MHEAIAAAVRDAEACQQAGDLTGARAAWARVVQLAEEAGQAQMQVHGAFHVAALDHALGDLDRALTGYRWVMARPTDPEWRDRLGPWFSSYAAIASIRGVAVRALRPGPDLGRLLDELDWVQGRADTSLYPALFETRGQVLYQLGRYDDAREVFAAAAAARRADPDSAGSSVAALLLRQAMAARDAGHRAAAEALLTEAAGEATTTVDRINAVLLRAELLVARHAVAAAAGLLDAVQPSLGDVPVDEVRLRWEVARATCAATADDLPTAVALADGWHERRLATQPPHVAGWLWHARCAVYNAAARFDEAVQAAGTALALEDATRAPESRAQAIEVALDALAGARDLATANALATDARDLADTVSADKRARLHLAIGRIALERGDPAGAARALDAAHIADPSPEVRLGTCDLRARTLAAEGDWAGAVEAAVAWERVVELPPAILAHGRAALRCFIAEAHLRDQAGLPRCGPVAVPARVRADPSEAERAYAELLLTADARDLPLGTGHFRAWAERQHATLARLLAAV